MTSTHGGARANSGRKIVGERDFKIKLSDELREEVRQKAKDAGLSMAEYIRRKISE